jgi:hypothetical protein
VPGSIPVEEVLPSGDRKEARRAAGDGPRTSALSCSINGFEDFSESLQPGDISLLGVFLNTFQPLYRLGLVAWLAGVVWGNHHLNLYGHDVAIGVNPSRCLDTLARNLHGVYYYSAVSEPLTFRQSRQESGSQA